jgi:2-oxoglutarate ferredoxin oxidoreductase subunit beta
LEKDYNSQDKALAFKRALEWGEKIPIGVFYKEERPALEDYLLPTKNTILAQESLRVNLKDILTEFQ